MIRRTQLETKEQKIAYMETKMSRPGIARIIVFSVILILLAFFSVGYTYETFNTSLKQQFIDVDDINNINIDGSDFTLGFRILGTGINSFLAQLSNARITDADATSPLSSPPMPSQSTASTIRPCFVLMTFMDRLS